MKGLAALIRLHTWQLDEKRRELVDLEQLQADLHGEIDSLMGEVQAEQKFAEESGGHGFTFGGFAIGVIGRRKKIETSIAELQVQIDAKRGEVANAYQELKRYEITRDQRLKREKLEADRRNQALLDEVALEQYARKD